MENLLKNCTLCPRNCGADRTSGKTGYCSADNTIKIAKASLHFWEEPVLSGTSGSGTVFFSGCPLRCIYCQNAKIALLKTGKEISVSRLCDIFFELEEKGAHNINFVTPTHYSTQIIKAIELAKAKNFSLPFVYNTSGYEKCETLKNLSGLIDIYLPDFKYINSKTAQNYSNAPDYPEIAKNAISEMFRQVGKITFSENNMAKSGLICRHLVLPGHIIEAKQIIKYLYTTFKDDIFISIMNQYTPMSDFKSFPNLSRKISEREYKSVTDYAVSLGVKNAFIQYGDTAKESFIPDFDLSGV